jgi:ABC-type multidrug transport system fused ATPase/permease subunit
VDTPYCPHCGSPTGAPPAAPGVQFPQGPNAAAYHLPYNASLILTLGILSVAFHLFTGIPAWIMGNNALAFIDRGQGLESDRTIVKSARDVGRFMTIFFVCVLLIYLVVYFLFFIVFIGMFQHSLQSAPQIRIVPQFHT